MNVSVKNLSKVYDGRHVLKDLDFEVHEGELTAVIGPNGAGKTTLIRILGLLEAQTTGEVYFDGVDIQNMGAKWSLRRRMALVPQRPAVFNTSIYGNIAVGLKVRGEKKNEIEKKVKDVLRTIGLSRLEHKNARALSGGEKQLLAMARAIVLEPELLLLDEPTSNLDPENTALVEDIIKNMDATVIMTSPRASASEIADRAVVLPG